MVVVFIVAIFIGFWVLSACMSCCLWTVALFAASMVLVAAIEAAAKIGGGLVGLFEVAAAWAGDAWVDCRNSLWSLVCVHADRPHKHNGYFGFGRFRFSSPTHVYGFYDCDDWWWAWSALYVLCIVSPFAVAWCILGRRVARASLSPSPIDAPDLAAPCEANPAAASRASALPMPDTEPA